MSGAWNAINRVARVLLMRTTTVQVTSGSRPGGGLARGQGRAASQHLAAHCFSGQPRREATSTSGSLQGSGAMATCWGNLLRGARALSRRPAAVLFGASAVSAGVWMAQSEWRRQSRLVAGAAGGAAEPATNMYNTADSLTAGAVPSEGPVSLQHFEQRLQLTAGVSMIPHPAKVDKGGEDAYFIDDRTCCAGVADGVGGWAEIGVDPGLYSSELMQFAKDATTSCHPGPNLPQQLLEVAYLSTTARGSSTACIVCLENERLHATNLGDSGFMVVRSGELAFLSPQQQHEFNFPYQLGSPDSMADTPQAAQRFSIDVQEGDIVLVATDGLFDNVYPDEAAALLTAAKQKGETPQMAAAALAQFASKRAGDPTHLSPFAYGAQQLGYRYYGGKIDDVTVVVGYVAALPAVPSAKL